MPNTQFWVAWTLLAGKRHFVEMGSSCRVMIFLGLENQLGKGKGFQIPVSNFQLPILSRSLDKYFVFTKQTATTDHKRPRRGNDVVVG